MTLLNPYDIVAWALEDVGQTKAPIISFGIKHNLLQMK